MTKVAISFFRAYPHPLDSDAFRRILTQAINNAKSSNPLIRTNSVELFKTTTTGPASRAHAHSQVAVPELLALPKSGKTAGPDHRVALYSMLALLPPSAATSPAVLQASTPLLAKETHEGATAVLAAALAPHIVFLLRDADAAALVPPETTALIAKEMTSAKAAVRRAFVTLAGSVFFSDSGSWTEKATAFAKALLPSFENCLKVVAGNPLNASGGPLEGYISVAVLLGPLAQSGSSGMPPSHSRSGVVLSIFWQTM